MDKTKTTKIPESMDSQNHWEYENNQENQDFRTNG